MPNPSFEIIDSCPYNQDQLFFAENWFKPTPNSSDLYNSCATVISSTVPANWVGWQQPRSGVGYAGIAAYGYYPPGGNVDSREYLSTSLSGSLIAGKKYCVEFHATRSNGSFWAVNRIGLYISEQPLPNDGQIDTLTAQPQIYFDTNTLFLDTLNWVKISGIYTATGGERFITIGNFFADNQTDTLGNLGFWIACYFYIDDVSVYELQECNAGEDVSICYKDSVILGTTATANVLYEWMPTSGLSDPSVANPLASPDTSTVYILKQTECDAVLFDTVKVTINRDCHTAPSIMLPTLVTSSQAFFIRGLESNSQLDIYDLRGRLIFASDDYQNDFIFSHEEQAFYIAVLTRPDGEQICEKVFVEKE